jgi:hypothetical protein
MLILSLCLLVPLFQYDTYVMELCVSSLFDWKVSLLSLAVCFLLSFGLSYLLRIDSYDDNG